MYQQSNEIQVYLSVLESRPSQKDQDFLQSCFYPDSSKGKSNTYKSTQQTQIDLDLCQNVNKILQSTNGLKFNKKFVDKILSSLAIPSVKGDGQREKNLFTKVLLAEREFYIALIRSLISNILAKGQQSNEGGQTERIFGQPYFQQFSQNQQ